MTIRDRHQCPVVLLRVASFEDVIRIEHRDPSDADLRAVTQNVYLVVRDESCLSSSATASERICRRSELTGSAGAAEVVDAVRILAAAARGHVVRFLVEETPVKPPASAACVQVEYDPHKDEIDMTPMERDPGGAWSWPRNATPVLRRSTLQQILATIERAREARDAAARDHFVPAAESEDSP
jgi:hypothetical protein